MPDPLLAAHRPAAVALVEASRSVSYGELGDLVERTAGGLVMAGVGFGDKVAVVGGNDIAFVTGVLAARTIGAVACPITSRAPGAEFRQLVEALEPAALVASPAAAAQASTAAGDLLDRARVGTPAGSPSPDIAPLPDGPPASAVDVPGDQASAVLQTSGIVGAPRAAVLTSDNLRLAQRRIIDLGPGLTEADVSFGALPLTHVLGLNMCLLPSLRVGATLVLHSGRDPHDALAQITRHRVTHVVGVPPMWHAWAQAVAEGGAAPEAMASVTFARAGASALHANVAEAVRDAFGLELGQGYGLTETAGTVTFEPHARRNPDSVGRPLPGVELRLVEDDEAVETGDRGEIWIRTGSVFQGYLGDAEATAEVLSADGWCRTGDIGIQDDDGTLYLVGRSKELINVSGFNVYPGEVEAALESHPDIEAAVVVGEPDQVAGERVEAYVRSPQGDALDTDAVVAHCRDRIARYKVPSSIHVVDRLPLTAIGKRVRSRLRSSA